MQFKLLVAVLLRSVDRWQYRGADLSGKTHPDDCVLAEAISTSWTRLIGAKMTESWGYRYCPTTAPAPMAILAPTSSRRGRRLHAGADGCRQSGRSARACSRNCPSTSSGISCTGDRQVVFTCWRSWRRTRGALAWMVWRSHQPLAKACPRTELRQSGSGGAPHMAGSMLPIGLESTGSTFRTKGGFANILITTTGERYPVQRHAGDAVGLTKTQACLNLLRCRAKTFPIPLYCRPVVAETPGLEGFVTGSWQGVAAAWRKLSAELNARCRTERRIIHTPDMKKKTDQPGRIPRQQSRRNGEIVGLERSSWAN